MLIGLLVFYDDPCCHSSDDRHVGMAADMMVKESGHKEGHITKKSLKAYLRRQNTKPSKAIMALAFPVSLNLPVAHRCGD